MKSVLRRWQTWAWAAALALAVYVVFLLVTGLLTPTAPVTPGDTEMVMRGIHGEGRHGKNIGWQFSADQSEISPDGYTTTYHNVHDARYYRDGKVRYALTATTVTVDSRNQNYSANGTVHVWSIGGKPSNDFRTDDAFWNEATQTLTCPAPVRLLFKGSVLHTTHMTVNLRTGQSELGDTSIDYRKASPSASPAPPSASRSL